MGGKSRFAKNVHDLSLDGKGREWYNIKIMEFYWYFWMKPICYLYYIKREQRI